MLNKTKYDLEILIYTNLLYVKLQQFGSLGQKVSHILFSESIRQVPFSQGLKGSWHHA